MSHLPASGLELRSLLTADAVLEVSLQAVPVPAPAPDEITVRIEAAPLNPSDLGSLLGPADVASARLTGSAEAPVLSADVPAALLPRFQARVGLSLPVGNEGAGTVVAAGSDAAAQALLGKTVALIGGGMYSQYRKAKAADVLVLPEGVSAAQGASSFVNPLTVLCMLETLRLEGHSALVHTAAASNLGQMLVKACLRDGVPLVNIVRSPAQVALLRELGAEYVCDSSSPDFMAELVAAVSATGATLGFDAIGGGKLAGQILTAMEVVAQQQSTAGYSLYGSNSPKQVYIYGGLDMGPTLLERSFGMNWGLGGWLLFGFMAKLSPERIQQLRQRVADEITTTFASHYTQQISLAEALQPKMVAAYSQRATGAKYLICPHKA
ncbi:MAG: zinc-binding dehydrogenase [Candidatus Sericytochromatia bacterium]